MVIEEKLKSYIYIQFLEPIKVIEEQKINNVNIISKDGYEIVVPGDKRSLNLETDGTIYRFRAPSYLRNSIGKNSFQYIERIKYYKNELMRIKLADSIVKEPYFTAGGTCIVPEFYINNYANISLKFLRISFNKTNINSIIDGHIFGNLMVSKSNMRLTFPLYSIRNYLKTKTMVSLIDIMNQCNKRFENFQYECTYNDGSMFGCIYFKEVKTDG